MVGEPRARLDQDWKRRSSLCALAVKKLYRLGSENCGIISVVDTNLARALLIESVKCDNGRSAEGRASNVERQSGSKEADKKILRVMSPNRAARFVHTNRRKTERVIFVPSPFRGLALPSFSQTRDEGKTADLTTMEATLNGVIETGREGGGHIEGVDRGDGQKRHSHGGRLAGGRTRGAMCNGMQLNQHEMI